MSDEAGRPPLGAPLGAVDLTRLRWAMEPAIDAAGHSLAYVESGPDAFSDRVTYRVHTVDVRTGTSTALDDAFRTRRPQWSADGRLGVLADIDDRWQVALADLDSGAIRAAATVPGDVRTFAWSPDGSTIACDVVSVSAGGWQSGSHVWLIDVATRVARSLTPPGFGDSAGAAWSPDGSTVAIVGAHASGSAVWLVGPVRPADARRVATARGTVRGLSWSPDGTTIAYLGHKSRSAAWSNGELWVLDTGDGTERRLGAGLDRSIGQVVRGDDERGTGVPGLAWTPAGDAVIAAYADGGTSAIASFPVLAGSDDEPEHLVDGDDRAVLEFDVASATGAIVFTWSDPYTPGEVSLRRPDGSEHPCSELGRALRDSAAIAGTERVVHVADDGVHVDGWLTVPQHTAGPPGGHSRVPLIVQIHGGPHYPVGLRFSFDAQRWAGQGIAVMRANPRGSQGYGAEFAAGIHGDWGGRDYRDVIGLVDSVLADGRFDAERVAIVGESYGGFLTMWTITRTDRFAAAVSENGISDLVAAVRHNPQFWSEELALTPGEEPERVRERSPITAAPDVRTPLLAVHATDDAVSPFAQSETMVAELTRHGRIAELIAVPGEGHLVNLVGRPSRRVTKLRRIDRFLAHHLRVPVVDTAADPPLAEVSPRQAVAR